MCTSTPIIWNCVHINTHHEPIFSFPHTPTHMHAQTNCPDGIWLDDLSCVVWGSLLLNPLSALGIPSSSSPPSSVSPSVLLHGWMNTYHLSDKEPSTLKPALSLRAVFARHKRSLSHMFCGPFSPDRTRARALYTRANARHGRTPPPLIPTISCSRWVNRVVSGVWGGRAGSGSEATGFSCFLLPQIDGDRRKTRQQNNIEINPSKPPSIRGRKKRIFPGFTDRLLKVFWKEIMTKWLRGSTRK